MYGRYGESVSMLADDNGVENVLALFSDVEPLPQVGPLHP